MHAMARFNKSKTVTARDVQSSVRLILLGVLAKHAQNETEKAFQKFGRVVFQIDGVWYAS